MRFIYNEIQGFMVQRFGLAMYDNFPNLPMGEMENFVELSAMVLARTTNHEP